MSRRPAMFNGIKLSFRDLYWNKVPKVKAQVVHLQFFQKAKLEWKAYAPVYRLFSLRRARTSSKCCIEMSR